MKAREIAEALGGDVEGDGNQEVVRAVHPLHASNTGDVAIALTPEFIRHLDGTSADIVLLPDHVSLDGLAAKTRIRIPLTRRSFPDVTALFQHRFEFTPGIHPTAYVHSSAQIDAGAYVGPMCVVEADVRLAEGVALTSSVTVNQNTQIGEGTILHSGVRVGHNCKIGARVVVQPNAVIGASGFGYIPVDEGNVECCLKHGRVSQNNERDSRLLKVHSLAGVIIEDDVDIGALTAVDAGTLIPTKIGRGTKIDNQVMIGHNVQIGENCLLVAQVGLGGSVEIGDRVVLGGRVGVADHRTIGDDVVVGAGSAVGTSIRKGSFYLGVPAVPHERAMRDMKNLRRLDRLIETTIPKKH